MTRPRVLIVTTNDVPGRTVSEVLGTVWGITVRSRSVGGQLHAFAQMVVGGEVTALSDLAQESRAEAFLRLEQHALEVGADAVLAVRFDSGELMQSTNEIIAYGTAVKLA